MSSYGELYVTEEIRDMVAPYLDKYYGDVEWELGYSGYEWMNGPSDVEDKMTVIVEDMDEGDEIGRLIVENDFCLYKDHNTGRPIIDAMPKKIIRFMVNGKNVDLPMKKHFRVTVWEKHAVWEESVYLVEADNIEEAKKKIIAGGGILEDILTTGEYDDEAIEFDWEEARFEEVFIDAEDPC
jgi:hypothetical protein